MGSLLLRVGMARTYPSGSPCSHPVVRTMFSLYLAIIVAGLAFYIVIGLTHH
jgi:hypothetical protein